MPTPGKVPIPGNVPVPILEKTSGHQKQLIVIVVALSLVLLFLLLLLFATTSNGGNGSGGGSGGGIGSGIGSGMGSGIGSGMGSGIGHGIGSGMGDDGGGSGSAGSGDGKQNEIGYVAGNSIYDESFQNGFETGMEYENSSEHPVNIAMADIVLVPTASEESEIREANGPTLEEPQFNEQKTFGSSDSLLLSNESNGGGSGGGGGGGGVTVRVFGVGGEGTKFMYVFDRSSSMTGHKLQEVKKELLKSFSVLNNNHKFNIIFYNTHFEVWKPGEQLITANSSAKKEAEKFVQTMTASGGTSHLPPLLEAIKYKPEVVFFLTDGQDLTQVHLEEICQKSGDICINVIQYDDGHDGRSEILRQLAYKNRGQYKYINVTSSDAL